MVTETYKKGTMTTWNGTKTIHEKNNIFEGFNKSYLKV